MVLVVAVQSAFAGAVIAAEALHFVIPAKAGIQLLAFVFLRFCRDNRLTSLCFFSRHPWRASHFSLLAQREVTKRKGTRVTRPLAPGSLRSDGFR